MAKNEVEQQLDHAVRIIGSILVGSNTPQIVASILVNGEFYKLKINIEKVVEGEE